MNHIYKVIWNKARNAYVVVSEFAKGYSRNTTHSRVTHSAAILRLAVLLACTTSAITVGAPLWVQAAATVDAGTTTNGDTNTLAVGSGSSANGQGALAVGGGSRASGDTAVALAWGSQALSDYAIAIGHSAHVGGSYTYSQGGNTGLGSTAFNAIAIGNTSTANGQNDVVIGANNTAATPTAAYYETDKTGNSSAIALGGRILIGHDNDATGRADNATVLGSNNVVNAPHGIAIGQNLQSGQASASGIESNNTMVLGVNSKALSSNSIALGNGATAGNSTNSGNAYGQGAVAIGESANSTAYYSVALGHNAQATNAMSVAIGDGSQASGWTSSAVGNGAKAEGYASVSMGVGAEAEKDYAVSMGAGAEASGENSIAIGGKGAHKAVEGNEVKTYYVSTQATGTSSVAIGRETTAAGNYSLAMGYLASVAKGATSGIALGDQTTTYGVNSVAIGAGATVGTDSYKKNVSGGVALGSGSDVFRDFKSQNWSTLGTTWTNWMDMKNPTNSHENVKWAATLGAVSIGSDGEEGTDALPASFYTTRQLTGLAAGTYDTDAVNVAQWKNTMLATVGDAQGSMYNSNYGTDGVNRNLTRLYDEQLTLTGAGDNGTALTKEQMSTVANIGTIVDDNKITFRLAKDITGLDSVTTGNTKMESKGITITNTDDNKKSITLDGSTGKATIGGVTVGYVNLGELQTKNGRIVPQGNYVYNLNNTTWDPSTYVSGRAATEDQLYSLGSAVTADVNNIEALLGDGSFGLTAEDNSSTTTNLGSTIMVKGDGQNITTKVADGDLQIELNKDLDLGANGSVTMGNTLLNGSGLTLSGADENSKIQISQGNVSMGGQQIHNVANGTNDTDAVNLSQLNEVKNMAGKQTAVTVEGGTAAGTDTYTGTNLQLKSSIANGVTTYDLKLSDTLNIGGAGKAGAPGQDGHMGINGADGKSGVAIDGKNGISIKGQDGKDGVTIKGIDGKDGVNGAEGHIGLNGKDGITDIWTTAGTPGLNGRDGETMTRIVYKDPAGNTHEAATLDDGLKFGGDFGTASAVKLNKQVNVKGNAKNADDLTDGNIGVVSSQEGDNGQLLIKLNKDLNLGNTGSVTMGNTTINNGGVTITNPADANKPVSLTDKGLNNGGNKITNIAAGDVSEGSTDAVNGSQLHAVEQKIQDVEKTAGQHTTVEAGSTNVSVTEDTNGAGGKKYTVDLATDVTFGSDANQIAINGTDGTVTVGTGDKQVKLDGTNGSVTAGGVTINKDSKGTIDGLTNTTWTEGAFTSGQAATEDQLHTVESNVNKKIDNINTAIENVDKHHTEVTVNGEAAPADGTYTEGNLQIAQTKGAEGQKIYNLKLSDNLNIGGAGKDGAPGKDGHMGINGADGKSGVGIDGKDGISIKGEDGQNGVTIKGVDGKDGTEGHIGLTGPKGADGQNATTDIHVKNGQNGVDGTDGHGGKDGMDRVVYEDHNGTSHEVATMNDGMKYSGDSGNAAVKLNNNVQISGGATEYADGANIGVVASQDGDNAKLQVKLAKDLTGINSIEAKTITTGNTTMDNGGLTVKGDDNHKDITIHQGNVNMGGNTVSGVADGHVAPGSTDAVNGGQLWQRDQAINSLGGAVNKLDSRVNRVGAGAAALAALHPLDFDPDDKWDFAAGYGNYKDASAVAVGAYYRPNEDTMFSIGGSFGGGENMVNAGVSFKLGQGNHISTSRVAMAKEIKDLRKEIEGLRSALADVAAGNRLDPTKTKLFPDIPQNHWAYNEIAQLYGNGIVQGYPDGSFGGDRMMTRYEFALMVYRQMQRGAALSDRIVNEFEPELERIRIDTITKDKDGNPVIQRVRVIKDRG